MPPKSVFVDVVVGGRVGVLRQFHPGLFGGFISLYFSTPEWSVTKVFMEQISRYFLTQLRIVRQKLCSHDGLTFETHCIFVSPSILTTN